MKITSVTDANGVTTTTIDTDAVSGSSADFSTQLNEQLKTTSSLEAIFEKAAKTMMDTLASIDTFEVAMMGHGAYHDYCGDCHDCCGGCNL